MKPSALAAIIFLGAPGLLHAGALDDLRARLDGLNGSGAGPLKATAEVRFNASLGEAGKEKNYASSGALSIETSAQGLRLSWSAAQTAAARREADARQADGTPAAIPTTLDILKPSEAAELLDYAPVLRRQLDGATLLQDSPAQWQGKPARLLVLSLVPRLSEEERKLVKQADTRLQLWLDAEGIPLALEYSMQAKASKFFISLSLASKQTRRFLVAANRLIVVAAEEETRSAGMGEVSSTRRTVALTLDSNGRE